MLSKASINLCKIGDVKSGLTKSSSIMTNIRTNFSFPRICFKKSVFTFAEISLQNELVIYCGKQSRT